MNLAVVMEWFDRLRTIPASRLGLLAVAVAAALAASTLTGVEAGHVNPIILTIVFGFALAAALRPDLHTGLLVEMIVVWHWLAGTHDPLSPLAMPVALCLFVFHAGLALMSVAPLRAVIDRTVIWRWAVRSGYVVIATVAAWLLVVVMNGRQAAGSVVLTCASFLTLTGLVLVARRRSDPARTENVRRGQTPADILGPPAG